MGMKEWLAAFRALHAKAKSDTLDGADRSSYERNCDELAKALLQAQKLEPRPGQAARDALRVPRAVQVDLAMTAGRQKMLTRELGRSGFTAVVAYGPAANERFEGTIRVPGQPEPVEIAVQVVSSRRAAGSCFVTFDFTRIDEAQRERLGHAVFDTALENLQV